MTVLFLEDGVQTLYSDNTKDIQSFLGIFSYLGKFLPLIAEVCMLLRKLTSKKTEWMWNNTYQKLYE